MEEWKAIAGPMIGGADEVHFQLKEKGFNVSRAEVRTFVKSRQMPDKKEYTEADVDDFIDKMYKLQNAQEKLDVRQVKATWNAPESKPIGIALWGDWHIGGSGVDYKRFEQDLETIANTDGLYWFGMGDYKDNYQTGIHPGSEKEQIIRPGLQDKAVERYVERAADNNLGLIKGCHDDWDYKNSDKDFISTLCKITGGFNLWHGGDFFVNLGRQQYFFKLRHKYKFESAINYENAMRRIMEIQGPCDVAGAAHLHNPYYMQRHLMGEYRVVCRTGSYKIWDEFSQKLAGYKGKPGIPTMILFPDKKNIIPLMLDDAITLLKALRN